MSMNEAVAERLSRIARLQDLLGEDKFKAISHDRAARIVEGLSIDIATIADDPAKLRALEGIGPKIADKIAEFARTGKMSELVELEAKVPAGVLALMNIPGLGPKTVATLWKEGGATDLAALKRIIADGSILKLPRMGAKSVEKLKESIDFAEQGNTRLPLGLAMPLAERFVEAMLKVKGVKQASFAGSLRRGRDTIGDIDILVAASDSAAAHAGDAFRVLPGVAQIIAAGDKKSSVRARIAPDSGRFMVEGKAGEADTGPTVQVDLRVVPAESWGAALMYFTGSKEFNIRLRERSLKMGLTLNEYGLFPEDDDKTPPQQRGIKPAAGETEEAIFHALKLAYVPPELREDRGEIDRAEKAFAGAMTTAAKRAAAPVEGLIELADIKAELHAHTTASDGRLSIEELATDAKKRGFHTIAVTDHSKSSVIAGGLSPERLREHVAAIHAARKKVKGIQILAGSEVDILADGSLDYDDETLALLDVVVGSPHNALSQEPEVATRRLIRAIESGRVHIVGHPTGRLLNRRAGLSPDMAKIIAAARANDVALEVNSHWMRLDLRDVHVRAAVDAGCLIAIDCDVHAAGDFDNLRHGVATARRGWLPAEQCVNTWTAERLAKWLRRKTGHG